MRRLSALLLMLLVCLFAIVPLAAHAQNSFVNGLVHDGQELTCDLQGSQHIKNIGSEVDHSGMCVFSSIEMAALYHGLEGMRGWRNWCAKNFAGGGYPEKVDKLLAAWFKFKGLNPADYPYIQVEGKPQVIDQVLQMLDKTGRMACVTYGYDERYGGLVYHMTCLPMYRQKWGVCLDNNFPGEDRYRWTLRPEMLRRVCYAGGSGWVFAWVGSGPPPSPRNRK